MDPTVVSNAIAFAAAMIGLQGLLCVGIVWVVVKLTRLETKVDALAGLDKRVHKLERIELRRQARRGRGAPLPMGHVT